MQEKKVQQYANGYKRGFIQIITKEYKGRFFNDYVEVTCFIKACKVKQGKRYECYK